MEIGGERIDKLSNRKLAAWRARHVGLVFQFYNLMPVLNSAKKRGIATAADPSVPFRAKKTRSHCTGHRRFVDIATAIIREPCPVVSSKGSALPGPS